MSVIIEKEKIEFVTSVNGTSCGDIVAVLTSASLLPTLSILLFPWLVPSAFTVKSKPDVLTHLFVRFLIEFPVVALFTGVIVTFLAVDTADFSLTNVVALTLLVTLMLILTVNHTMTRPRWKSVKEEWEKVRAKSLGWTSEEQGGKEGNKYPFLTNFRGMITYLTVFTILAIDFPIFPRRFAKTKEYGMSLMDIGTASFIFSNGIVAPEAKNRRSSIKKAVISCIPLLVLGLGRLMAVKGTEYHEVVEEYGVHWNFFFTLAAVKILGAVIFSFLKAESALKACGVVAVLYELYLTVDNKIEDYILNPAVPRNSSLVDANREGIFSAFGYLAIYMGSVYCGNMIYSKKRKTVADWTNFVVELAPVLVFFWSGFFVSHYYWIPVCRRAANLSYVLWSLAVNLTILTLHVFLSVAVFVVQHLGILHGPMISYQLYVKNMKGEGKYFETGKAREDIAQSDDATGEEIEGDLEELEKQVTELKEAKSRSDLERLEAKLRSIGAKLVEEESKQEAALDSIDNISCLPNLAGECLFYKAVCFNGLIVFLLGNLLTGLVNLSVRTEIATTTCSTAILLAYVTAVYFSSFSLYYYNVQLKFW